MVSVLDEAFGNVTTALEQRGLLDNTLLIFTSDVSKMNSCAYRTMYTEFDVYNTVSSNDA